MTTVRLLIIKVESLLNMLQRMKLCSPIPTGVQNAGLNFIGRYL
ncbi:hypothetical protein Cflav_PD4327 [Pedosphaera parvula Ellin514]|uniref:Uncharacterized protein n=1 Tax=Pedosphaera parvula (strain Ellin514) TaxID=320771 RepID=B9XFE2_PEDPL|nr:hypothetical protein Cflav_PD4327 [Pedosphaera parvula Ellin514]